MSFSVMLSVGKYGGFYITRGDVFKRVCLGFVAVTITVPEYDEIFNSLIGVGFK